MGMIVYQKLRLVTKPNAPSNEWTLKITNDRTLNFIRTSCVIIKLLMMSWW